MTTTISICGCLCSLSIPKWGWLGVATLKRHCPAKWLKLDEANGWERWGDALKSPQLLKGKPGVDRHPNHKAPTPLWCWKQPIHSDGDKQRLWCAKTPLTGAIRAARPPRSGREELNPAQEGLIVRRKHYLMCIVLGKENKGPGTAPGPLASFFSPLFFSSGQLF